MLHRVSISNFKSLVDVTVDLDPVTVLVGQSGTGKSNFIRAIQFLRDYLISGPRVFNSNEELQQLSPATNPGGMPTFEVEVSVAGMAEPFTYTLKFQKQRNVQSPSEESLKLGDTIIFHQRDGSWICEPNVVQPPQPNRLVIGSIPSLSEVVIAFTALTEGIGCYVLPPTVLIAGSAKGSGLSDDAGNYLGALKDIVSDLQDLNTRKSIIASLARINPSVTAVELDSIQNPKKVIVGHRVNGKTLSLDLSQESDGFRRFYAHLLAIYQRPSKQTLLFEEPENGIYPGALELLADEFKAAYSAGRGQVILTTHSPRLLDHFDAENIRVVELVDFGTHIGPVSESQRNAVNDKLLDPGELLTVDAARTDAAEAAVE